LGYAAGRRDGTTPGSVAAVAHRKVVSTAQSTSAVKVHGAWWCRPVNGAMVKTNAAHTATNVTAVKRRWDVDAPSMTTPWQRNTDFPG